MHALIAADPFGYLAYLERAYLKATPDCEEAVWYSDFHHRMVILVAQLVDYTRSTHVAGRPPKQELIKNQVHSIKCTMKLACDVIRVSHPEEAKLINEVYLQELFNRCGVKIIGLYNLLREETGAK